MARKRRKPKDEELKQEPELKETNEALKKVENEDNKEEEVKEEKPVTEPKSESKPEVKEVPKYHPTLVSYLDAYLNALKKNQPYNAAKYLANAFRLLLNENISKEVINLQYVVNFFKKHKDKWLHESIALQGVESLDIRTRVPVEMLYVIFRAISTGQSIQIDFNRLREHVKCEPLIKFILNRLNK